MNHHVEEDVDAFKDDHLPSQNVQNVNFNNTPKADAKTDKAQVIIGISVSIATVSLIALIVVVVHTVKHRVKDDKSSSYDQNKHQIDSSLNSQFTIVPINRSNLQSSQVQNETMSSYIRDNIAGCLRNNTQSCSSRSSEMTNSTEFDYYDYTNNRAPVESYYGNGGTVVHV